MIVINIIFGFALGVFLDFQGMGITTYQYWVIVALLVGMYIPWNRIRS